MTSASVPASEAPPLRDAHERRIPAPVFWELVAVVVPLVEVIIAIPVLLVMLAGRSAARAGVLG